MATIAAARSIFRSASAQKAAARIASETKAARSPFSVPTNKPLSHRIFRYAAQMSVLVETMQPFHTVTASALMTSMLSVSRCSYSWLPEACNADV
ncbi:hypothetical protein Ancab_011084 [Ancistrocladus abbreviatus]